MKSVSTLPFPKQQIYFTRSMKFLTVFLMIVMMMVPGNLLQACGGTPVPPCGRAVFLGKFTPGVVVFPGGGGAINVPIGVLPFAQWNTTGLPAAPICPQPVAATLNLVLTCFPSGTVIGPLAFPVAVPTVPGAQPLGGLVNFVIPAGTFPPGTPPQICLVVGTYSVTFSDAVVLAFIGDTEVCIVPPSPLAEDVPELDMQYIPVDGEDYRTCRRGDQANFYFLIANNDPTQSVSLDLTSIGRQIAHLPEGVTPQDAYTNDVYSVSLPEEGTDTYPAAFADELMPGELLDEPDPNNPDPQMLSRSLVLQPCEATIICIAMRSYGMCANGSCNERLVKVEGTWDNGDPALACASTLYVVDDAPPKTVLCEVFDSLKVSPNGEAIWSPGHFLDNNGPIPLAESFFAGNLPPGPTSGGFRTSGEQIPDLFAATASDYLRISGQTIGMNYNVNYNSPQCNNGFNNVTVFGIDNPGLDLFSMPIISFQGFPDPLDIEIDLFSNQMLIFLQGDILFEGPIDLFFVDPPPEFCIDPDICRIIGKVSDFSEKTIFAEPPVRSRLFDITDINPGCDSFEVFDNNVNLVNWGGTVSGSGIMLPSPSGLGLVEVCYDNIDALPVVPATTIAYVDITCPNALNNPLRVPFAIRVKDTMDIPDYVLESQLLEQRYVLHPCVPNPFSDRTSISFTLSESAKVSLKIYNRSGKKVRSLFIKKKMPAGKYYEEWDGRDDDGSHLSEGLYICQMTTGKVVRTSNIVLVH